MSRRETQFLRLSILGSSQYHNEIVPKSYNNTNHTASPSGEPKASRLLNPPPPNHHHRSKLSLGFRVAKPCNILISRQLRCEHLLSPSVRVKKPGTRQQTTKKNCSAKPFKNTRRFLLRSKTWAPWSTWPGDSSRNSGLRRADSV